MSSLSPQSVSNPEPLQDDAIMTESTSGKISAVVFAVGMLLVSMPLLVKISGILYQYLANDTLAPYVFMSGTGNAIRHNVLSSVWLITIVVMTVLAPLLLLSRMFAGLRASVTTLLVNVMSVFALAGLLAFLFRIGIYNSSGLHIGSQLLSLQTSSAYGFMAFFIIYRLIEEKHRNDDASYSLFVSQMLVVAWVPVLLRVSYGIWYGLLGSWAEASFGQQATLLYGCFLIPMGAIFLCYLKKDSIVNQMPKVMPLILSLLGVLLVAFGTISYMNNGLIIELY